MASSNEIVQIDLINKGLTTLNLTLDQTAAKYLTIVKSINDNSAVIQQQTATVTNLNAAQKATVATQTELDKQNKVLADSTKKLQGFDAAIYEQLQRNNKALADNKKAINDKIKASESEEGSLVRMRQKLSELTKEYDKAGVRTKEAADQINKLSKEIGAAEAATNRHTRSVGDYKQSIKSAASEMFAWAAPAAAAAFALNGLKEAFLGTEAGAKLLMRAKLQLSSFFENIVQGNFKYAFGNQLPKDIKESADLMNKIRIDDRNDLIEIAKRELDIKNTRIESIKAAGDLVKQASLLKDVEAKENDLIKFKLEDKQEELSAVNMLLLKQKDNTVLLDKQAQLEAEILNIKGEKSIRVASKLEALNEKIEQKKVKDAADALQATEKALAKNLKNTEAANAKQVQLINKDYIDGKLSDQEYKTLLIMQEKNFLADKLTLYKSGSKEYEDIQVQIQASSIKRVEETHKKELDLDQKAKTAAEKLMADMDKEREDQDNKEKKDAADKAQKEIDLEKKKQEQILEQKKKVKEIQFKMAEDLVNGIFDIGSAKRDEELNALEKEKSFKLKNKNLTESQKAKIEEEYEKKANAIKLKQAKADKLQAAFSIALDTLKGTVAAGAMPPLFWTNPMIPWIIAAGALQAALVMAVPLPKFKHGTLNAPDKGIFGEAGRELAFLRSGEIMMAEKATYFEGSKFKGAKIYSNPETEKLLKYDHSVGGRQMTDERILLAFGSLERTIKNKPVLITDKENRIIGQKMSNHQEIYLNRLLHN